jgi:hypothetical protein
MLRCAECGDETEADARGWQARLVGGVDDEPEEVAVFCPKCAEREFGESDGE